MSETEERAQKKDWDKKMQDIRDHTCDGRKIVLDDRPRELKIGFACEGCGEEWNFSLVHVKDILGSIESEEERESFRKSIGTTHGRKSLASSLN